MDLTLPIEAFSETYNALCFRLRDPGTPFEDELLIPFEWYAREPPLQAWEEILLGSMARLAALYRLDLEANDGHLSGDGKRLKAAVVFLDGYVERGEVSVAESGDPYEVLRAAAWAALDVLGARADPILADVPEMAEFQSSLRGQVSQEVLELSDEAVFQRLDEVASSLLQCKNAAYNVFRRLGNEWLAPLEAVIHRLLPCDQGYILHALEVFPGDAGVLAFFDRFLASTKYETCRNEAQRYRDVVAAGG